MGKEIYLFLHMNVCKITRGAAKVEAQMVLELTVEAKRKCGFIVGFIVADDNSSMRVLLRHSYEHLSAMMSGFVWPSAAP
eukprot:944098-Ditylum_brightwellii.AAC.1